MTDHEFSFEDVPYRTVDGIDLQLRVYRPDGGARTWVMESHGGAWANGDRTNNAVLHEAIAEAGVGVVGIDFRLSSQARYPGPAEDINFAIRWFKANAGALGIEIARLGGLGTSSGGQQMGLMALKPDDPEYCKPAPGLDGIDASLEFFAACWPILDPLARYHMAREAGNERLVKNHDLYFEDEAAMARANPHLLLKRGEATHLPPAVIIQGTADNNVNHEWQDLFADDYRAAGGQITVHKFADQPHTFATNDPDTPAGRAAIAALAEFVSAQAV